MADSSGDWCTIESDPGIFTSLIESFGVKNVELTELWSLDDDSLKTLTAPIEGVDNAAVHGLIFLFKWQRQSSSATASLEGRGTPLTGDAVPEGLFFAQQTVQNACATQAILSVLFNARDAIVAQEKSGESKDEGDDNGRRLVLGQTLSNFKDFTCHFPPDLRGEAIGSSDEIRKAHNSFGRSEDAFLSDPTKPKRTATDDDDVFHFIAYVPHEDGCVYELDGLQKGPIQVGEFKKDEADKDQWIKVARDAIQARLSNYSPTEIKFNLMAIVQDRRTYLNERLRALAAVGIEENDSAMVHIQSELHAEEEKRAQWALENARRHHNYLPFCVELLRSLAGCGEMEGLMTKAKTRAAEKRKRQQKS
mmetsp:Transcript_2862/g.4394  ORF Transcript_2862/g.4394 Transcript_2862/m.4394 type:complete len:364 (+) Transcript_2862:129-1220(+)